MIKEVLKQKFIGRYAISILHCVECAVLPKLISDEKVVKRFYMKKTGKELNLDNPHSFAEKLNWYKLNARLPLMQKCADKVAVRDYIKECGYGECLNEQYAVYTNIGEIDLSSLPDSFVLKAAHGSHMNIIVKDKKDVNWKQAKMMMSSWLHQDIYWSGREWVYKDMPRRIIAEKYLDDGSGELKDYKFFCFNGIPQFMQYDSGRYVGKQYRNYYNMNLEFMPFHDRTIPENRAILKPLTEELFTSMKEIASKLAQPFQFVRVDLYVVDSKIYFGEMTFFDGGGFSDFEPADADLEVGSYWKIQEN